jgi:hypothetical protein
VLGGAAHRRAQAGAHRRAGGSGVGGHRLSAPKCAQGEEEAPPFPVVMRLVGNE